jgi:diguanylate cyclase (GGDEF)-like protein
VTRGPSPRSSRPGPEDPSIRRTWWLLLGAFLLLVAIVGPRALGGSALDRLALVVVVVAGIAAVGHRNAVAGLEAQGRAEAESFARILRGLSRSVSGDAIIGAIVDDLADGTDADHVVVVRKSADGQALQATLVTRRAGVPASTTVLPLSDLEAPLDHRVPAPVAVPVGAPVAMASVPPVAIASVAPVAAAGPTSVAPVAAAGPTSVAPVARPSAVPARSSVTSASAARAVPRVATAPASPASRTRRSSADPVSAASPTIVDTFATVVRSIGRELVALVGDLGVSLPGRPSAVDPGPRSAVIGSGASAAIALRIADRVRSVYGLGWTLAAPLPGDDGIAGAIVLSRRDRAAWSPAARRLLVGAASEAAAALARATSYREATARASTDPLTGLPNRRYFDEFCGLLARRRRSGDAVAVLMVDIDHFKRLNDTYGHPVGDEVLRAVAGAIAAAVREEDVPARVGGEEFAVLLRNPGPGIATEVGERVRESVRRLDLSEFGVGVVTVSVGAANAAGADEPIARIIERADQALLTAKRAGRDRVVAD